MVGAWFIRTLGDCEDVLLVMYYGLMLGAQDKTFGSEYSGSESCPLHGSALEIFVKEGTILACSLGRPVVEV